MKHVFKRMMSVVIVLCLILSITAHAADSTAAGNFSNETQSITSVNTTSTSKVMMLKLNETQAYLNGNMIPTLVYDSGYVSKLIMVNGSTLLPLRFVCQCLGFEVGYNEQTNNSTITDTENGVRFELVTGTTEMYKYDLEGNLLATGTATAPTTIIEGVTHVPVRSLLEAMGFHVYWDDAGYVLISENPMTAEEFQTLISSWGQTNTEYLDTDGDGILDIYETDLLNTDPNNPDTDGDGLPDGYEVFTLGTNPLEQDSDDNGILDGAEDADVDGLTNLQELTLGTNPLSEDTDGDGLIDYDEVNTHGTNPILEDSDNDFINDGDEIIMGLNPLSPQTFSVHDSQYTFNQSMNATVLEEINTDNPYELEIDIQSAGNANTSLEVHESVSNTNNAIFGKPIELLYDENLKFNEMTLSFVINSDLVDASTGMYDDPNLAGINRFQIFHFDEETGVLCPVETDFDEINNTLSATVGELGEYMLIDLDLWMYTLGIVPEGASPTPQTVSIQSEADSDSDTSTYFDSIVNTQVENALGTSVENVYNSRSAGSPYYNKQIDLVFAVNVQPCTNFFDSLITVTGGVWSGNYGRYDDPRTNINGQSAITHLKESIKRTVSSLYARNITARVCIITFGGDPGFTIHRWNGSAWAKTPAQVSQMLSSVGTTPAGGRHLDVLAAIMDLDFRPNVQRFVIMITNNALNVSANSNTVSDIVKDIENKNITSFVVASSEVLQPFGAIVHEGWNALAFDINGVIEKETSPGSGVYIEEPFLGYVDAISERIIELVPMTSFFNMNDFSVSSLDEPLKYNGTADTDGDTLTDWEEMDTNALEFFAPKVYEDDEEITRFPTYGEYLEYIGQTGTTLVSKAETLMNMRVFPFKSNPTKADSDDDGVDDAEEGYIGTLPLVADTDHDGLSDGEELRLGFDPLNADSDGDRRKDGQEYREGTDPFTYDKNVPEIALDFISGFCAGEFIRNPGSLYTVAGQIVGSFIPFFADARDILPNLQSAIMEDPARWIDVGLNGLGFGMDFLGGADATIVAKAGATVGRFITKNADDIPKALKLLDLVDDNLPKAISDAIKNSDEVADAMAAVAKSDLLDLTRQAAKQIDEIPSIASKFLRTTDLPIKEVLNVGGEATWSLKPTTRGKIIDALRNTLGETFPVVDRLLGTTLISTKSLDTYAKSYQTPSKLRSTLNSYRDALINFEAKYWKGENVFTWNNHTLNKSDYNKKVLEIVLPDGIISPEIKEVFTTFQKDALSKGIEVWYIIGN